MTKDYKKEREMFRKGMKKYERMAGGRDKELDEWLDKLENRFREVSKKSIQELPASLKKSGFAEAYFTGLARFTCRLLNGMERSGMFNKGYDGFGFYNEVLMPIANDLVKEEIRDEEEALKELSEETGVDDSQVKAAKAIFDALADDKMTVEEIVDMYIQTDDPAGYIEELTKLRAEIRKKQESEQ